MEVKKQMEAVWNVADEMATELDKTKELLELFHGGAEARTIDEIREESGTMETAYKDMTEMAKAFGAGSNKEFTCIESWLDDDIVTRAMILMLTKKRDTLQTMLDKLRASLPSED